MDTGNPGFSKSEPPQVDLYADLDFPAPNAFASQIELISELKERNSQLQKQNAKLASVNKILLNNISCLFKTAREEIDRKDAEIKRLRQELQQMSVVPKAAGVHHECGPSNNPVSNNRSMMIGPREDSARCRGTDRRNPGSSDDWSFAEPRQTDRHVPHEVRRAGHGASGPCLDRKRFLPDD
eukprot:ANDGO_06424.mRNA.1 hypothetical protein PPTG_04783